MDLEPGTIERFWERGYAVLPSVFQPEQVEEFRRRAYANRDLPGDLLSSRDLKEFVLDEGVLRAAKQLLGAPPVYFGDSGCTFNGISGFHKDNPDRHDENGPDWTRPERYTVIRFALYLQDHSDHSGGIGFRRGSNHLPKRSAGRSVYAASGLGDVVVWPLRTTHRGTVDLARWSRIPLGRKLARWVPAAAKVPRPEGDRVALFSTYGADGPHFDRFLEYLRHRTFAIERWRQCVYDEETRDLIRKSGLIVRDQRSWALDKETTDTTYKHAPLPY